MVTAGMPVVRLRGGVVHVPPECAGKEALRHSGGTLRKRENAGRFPQVPRYGEVVLRHEAMPRGIADAGRRRWLPAVTCRPGTAGLVRKYFREKKGKRGTGTARVIRDDAQA